MRFRQTGGWGQGGKKLGQGTGTLGGKRAIKNHEKKKEGQKCTKRNVRGQGERRAFKKGVWSPIAERGSIQYVKKKKKTGDQTQEDKGGKQSGVQWVGTKKPSEEQHVGGRKTG